ncbi:Phospholipase/Carboxylesterase family protein [Niveomyces insectorum RCEF 264]|uniref:Phospholipase/Carboxylesterase family protein n=1 Tax=Niveomyces insectorum RCEF 264 TaxID=1081102 RepID=A0A167RYI5_9HYPO|nr:Phospholipase/Carboxylesterase family protein [Niveomyces insectorum RCEF 264]
MTIDEPTVPTPDAAVAAAAFGPVHVLEPSAAHTHTAVWLHGRNGSGPVFAGELMADAKLADGRTLAQALPGWRWVFPSSFSRLWCVAFEAPIPAWFDAPSLTDIAAQQDRQPPGLRAAVQHVAAVLDNEIARLDGRADRVVLGGWSQGGATALWTLLARWRQRPVRLGAFLPISTWLPFAPEIAQFLTQAKASEGAGVHNDEGAEGGAFVRSMLAQVPAGQPQPFASTPVFMGHSTDDQWVDITLGRQARDILQQAGLRVTWKEYAGSEKEGHWFKVPEELDDLVRFLGEVVG